MNGFFFSGGGGVLFTCYFSLILTKNELSVQETPFFTLQAMQLWIVPC